MPIGRKREAEGSAGGKREEAEKKIDEGGRVGRRGGKEGVREGGKNGRRGAIMEE